MKPSKVWEFIGSSAISLVTVVLGILVLFLDQVDLLPDTAIAPTILGLIVLLATSEIVENRRQLSRIDEDIKSLSVQVQEALQGAKVLTFSTQVEAVEYFAKRLREANNSVDIAALGIGISQNAPSLEKYYKAREAVILSERVRVRYIGVLYSTRRLANCLPYIGNPKVRNYFAGFYRKPPQELPLITFTVVDGEEILTFSPYRPGVEEGYIAITSSYIVRLFQDYFEILWDRSQKIRTQEEYDELLSSILAH